MNKQLQLLSINEYSRPGAFLRAVLGVVLHWVGNPGTSAKATRDYFENLKNQKPGSNARYASAHYIVGLEGEIIQCVPDNEIAYHAGAQFYTETAKQCLGSYPNNSTIGIELCHPDWIGIFTDKTLDSCFELLEHLREQHGLSRGDIYRHFDITGKICPKYFVDNKDEYKRFLDRFNKIGGI